MKEKFGGEVQKDYRENFRIPSGDIFKDPEVQEMIRQAPKSKLQVITEGLRAIRRGHPLPSGDSLCYEGEPDGHDLTAEDFEHTSDPIDARTPLIDRIPESEEIVLFFPKQSAPSIDRTD